MCWMASYVLEDLLAAEMIDGGADYQVVVEIMQPMLSATTIFSTTYI